jgi:hypothetical protein
LLVTGRKTKQFMCGLQYPRIVLASGQDGARRTARCRKFMRR